MDIAPHEVSQSMWLEHPETHGSCRLAALVISRPMDQKTKKRVPPAPQIHSHHLIHTASKNACSRQVLQHNPATWISRTGKMNLKSEPVGKEVHIAPDNPRSTSCKNCTVCPQHCIVHNLHILT